MKLSFSKTALSSLEKLNHEDRKRIIEKLEWFALHDTIFAFTKPVIGIPPATHRLRIGDYRVLIYFPTQDILSIVNLGHRKEIYR